MSGLSPVRAASRSAMDAFATLNAASLERTPRVFEPYEYAFVEHAVRSECQAALLSDAPKITHQGSFPLPTLSYGRTFQSLVDDLLSADFRQIVEHKFAIDLSASATMLTVRGYCSRSADGHVHTDTRQKIITVLLYLNPGWKDPGGRLRVLRSKNIEDYALEIPADFGNMLIFRRSDSSWHGHLPCEGPRLSIQLNWVSSTGYSRREQLRHRIVALFKGTSQPEYEE